MLRGIIITPDEALAEELQDLLSQVSTLGIVRWVDRYPNAIDLGRTLRAHSPQVVFLGLQDMDAAFETASRIEACVPGMQIVTFGNNADPQALIALMRVGIREYLSSPFQLRDTLETLSRVQDNLERNPLRPFESEYIFSFLPSKPGVGTSTIAMNAAWACSRLPETKTLLMDLDLNSGMQRFMLKLDNEYSIVDASENAFKLDETLWPQLVTTIGHMDVLHSGRLNPGYRIEGAQIRSMVEFARRNYQSVCVDLSGNMEKYSIEIMQESKRVYLVTTPEIASLHLARERYHYLRQLDLGDRIQLVLNRSQKRAPISVSQIEDLLGLPVLACIQNDYQGVSRALTAGKPVDISSELGREFQQLASAMMERKPAKMAPKAGKSIADYLSILPGKSILFADKKNG
jgi:pilus assembly protein CpaE